MRLNDLHAPGWTDGYGIEHDGAALVRPDGYVAGRWPSVPPPAYLILADARATILRPPGPSPQSDPATPKPGTLLRKRTVDLLLTMGHNLHALTWQNAAWLADLGAYRA